MKRLSEDELRGVIAHELAHIRNRDVLLQSVAAAIGASITYLGYMLLWFGGDEDSGPLGLIAALALVILAPIAASLIQLGVSRQREYSADATGAEICGNPESLASALLRLEESAAGDPDAGELRRGAALHRQAVQGRRHGRRCSRPIPRSRSGSGASARCARRSARLSEHL